MVPVTTFPPKLFPVPPSIKIPIAPPLMMLPVMPLLDAPLRLMPAQFPVSVLPDTVLELLVPSARAMPY